MAKLENVQSLGLADDKKRLDFRREVRNGTQLRASPKTRLALVQPPPRDGETGLFQEQELPDFVDSREQHFCALTGHIEIEF